MCIYSNLVTVVRVNAHKQVSVPLLVFLLAVILLPLISAEPARLQVGRRVIAVPPWRKGLVLAMAGRWVEVITITLGWWRIVTVTLRLWAAVVTVALGFGLRVVVRDGGQGLLLDVSVCLAEATFSLMKGAQLGQATGWTGQNEGMDKWRATEQRNKHLHRKSWRKHRRETNITTTMQKKKVEVCKRLH